MKVALIRPPKVSSLSAPATHGGVPPIGMAYLAAALEEAGHDVVAIDAFGEAPDQSNQIKQYNLQAVGLSAEDIAERIDNTFDLIAVSAMFSQEWIYTKLVITSIAQKSNAVLIIGGEHATAVPEHILKTCPDVDACCLGEGEETIVDIADSLQNQIAITNVLGLCVRDDRGNAVFTEPRKRIKHIDDISRPAWHLFPIQTYLDRKFAYEEKARRTMPMLATRGCPYKCTFCSNNQMWGIKWVARDPAKVVEEIRDYQKQYQVSHVEFYDLTAIVDRRWILQFTTLLVENNINITWRMPSGTRSEALDREVIRALKDSGCVGIVYAPESGSPTTLNRIKKKTDPNRMLASMRVAVEEGLHVRAHFIVGMPDQSLREIFETYVFIFKLALYGVYDVNIFAFFPYPGTELFRQLVHEGKIDPEHEDFDLFLARACFTDMNDIESWNNSYSPGLIKSFCFFGMGMFYAVQFLARPLRFFRLIKRLITGQPFTWLERYLYASFRPQHS